MKSNLSLLGFIIAFLSFLGLVFATQHFENSEMNNQLASSNSQSSKNNNGLVEPIESTEPLPGEETVLALFEAYPGRITKVDIIDGEWALEMDGIWYYWAEGRLLPEESRENWDEYISLRFYRYNLGPFEQTMVTPETAERLRRQDSAQTLDTRMRFNDFLDSLYQVSSRQTGDAIMVRTRIFGLPVRVHPLLLEPLAGVNRRVGELAKADPEIHMFLLNLREAHGYNWRNIANTLRRSYHSYGIAVDLLPRSYQRRQVYWLWAAQSGIDEWWDLSVDDRWMVPDKVIEAFESEGFIWGGKWLSFDNIHFEYRPEVILLSSNRNVGPRID